MREIASLLLLVVSLAAQRAPCTGTLVDLDGKPLARASVTFVQEESQNFGGELDRVEARTDADGAFAGDLLLGSPYVVWAIGPSDDDGKRWLTGVSMEAAGGKNVELLADRHAAARPIELTGVAAWSAHLPTALRILIDGRYPLGPDRPLSGDCVLPLGPWPGHDVVLALVDDKRERIVQSGPFCDQDARVVFPAVREVQIEVVDADDDPIQGARIAVGGLPWMTPSSCCDPLPAWQWQAWRQSGRTDEAGRAQVQVPDVYDVRIVASHPGFAPSVSGFIRGRPFADFDRHPDAEAPLRVVLCKAAPARLQLGGFGAGSLPRVLLWPYYRIGAGRVDVLQVRAGMKEPVASAALPAGSPGAHFFVRLSPTAEAPRRVCSNDVVDTEEPGDLDVRGFAKRTVHVVDPRGRPVAFAHVAIVSLPNEAYLLHDRCVVDAEGRASLLLAPAEWIVAATDGPNFGTARIDAAAPGAETRVVLTPQRMATVRVLDRTGARIAGARIEDVSSNAFAEGERWLGECARAGMLSARSDRDGLLRLPLGPRGFGHVIARHGNRRSGPMSLTSTVGVTIAELH